MNFTPAKLAHNLPRNSGKRGDTIVYRSALGLRETMTVEDVTGAQDLVNVVYMGSGKRIVHSRNVLEVRHTGA